MTKKKQYFVDKQIIMKNFKNIVLAICLLVTLVAKGQILPVHITTEMAENPLAIRFWLLHLKKN
jgi:hypothetical protein